MHGTDSLDKWTEANYALKTLKRLKLLGNAVRQKIASVKPRALLR